MVSFARMEDRVRMLSQQLVQTCHANRLTFELEHAISDIDLLSCFAKYVGGHEDNIISKYSFLRASFDLLLNSSEKDMLMIFCCRDENKMIGLMRSQTLSDKYGCSFPYFSWEDSVPSDVVNRFCSDGDVIIWCYS